MRRLMKSALFIAAVATLTVAADKPNFSGDWKLDADKSTFGPMPPPTSMTRKVDHADPALTVSEARSGGPQGDTNVTMKYTTDGKEAVNSFMGNDMKSTVTWDGNTMLISSKGDFGGNEIKFSSKWSLSEDGKVLTDVWHIATPQGEFDLTYVMTKQ